MAKINRSDIIQKAVNDLAISTANDKVPTETLDKVQLTYGLNKKFSEFVFYDLQSTSGSVVATLPNPGDRGEVYLTSISLGMIKDVACDIATGTVRADVVPAKYGVSKTLLSIPVITLTAQNNFITLSLPYPLKIKSGTNVTISGSYTAGVMSRTVSGTGFIVSSN